MTIRYPLLCAVAVLLLLGSSFTLAADCKFTDPATDPDTGAPIVATKMVNISTAMATIFGGVQAVSIGDDKFLAFGLRARNEIPIPPELNIDLNRSNREYRTGRYDPRLDDVLRRLKEETAFVSKGSTLRITLQDRSVIVLRSNQDRSARNSGTKPQHDSNDGPNFVILSAVTPLYPLDETMIEALTSRLATSIRMETDDRYYQFGSRMNDKYPLTIGKKNGKQLQEALNCVL